MNKVFRSVVAGALLTAALSASALAADFTPCADTLHSLGLFEGTERGYALDRAPTRAEAAVMLVRLLGHEADAEVLTYTAPFTDLAAWEQPYIQYLYENGLTQGTSASLWSPEDKCDAQMYAAFLLRSLGYTEGAGDFTYTDAVQAAERLGLYDPAAIDTEVFSRDDVAAASYTALSVSPKGEEDTLLDRLTAQDAVDKTAAAQVKRLFANYENYCAMTAKTAEQTERRWTSTAAPFAVRRNGEELMQLSFSDTTAADLDECTLSSSGTLTLSAPNVADKVLLTAVTLESGALTCSAGAETTSDACSAKNQAQRMGAFGRVPLAYISSLTRSNDEWSIVLSSSVYDAITDCAALAMPGGDTMQVGDVRTVQTVSGGKIVRQTVSLSCTAGEYTAAFSVQSVG